MTKNQFIHLAVIHAINKHTLLYISDGDMIKCFKEIAKFADELDKIAPFDKIEKSISGNPNPAKDRNTRKLFDGFLWKKEGVTRSEIETYLKANSGYTSNRAMQTIINNALAEGVMHKDLVTRKYLPGENNASA